MTPIFSLWVPHTGGTIGKQRNIGEDNRPLLPLEEVFCYTVGTGNS